MIRLIAVVVIAPWVALAIAQSDAVERPQVKPGDTWTYRRIDLSTNKATGTVVTRVTFANERAIQATVKTSIPGLRIERDTDATMTAEWNVVSSATGAVFTPHSGHLKFPLRAGDTFVSKFRMRQPRLGAFNVEHERKVSVLGWEEISVPAGRFRALKVESVGSYHRTDADISGNAKEMMWYAPEVKYFVKWTYEDSPRRSTHERQVPARSNGLGDELVEYQVQ